MVTETRPIRILYIEDDPGSARLFQKRLRKQGYAVDVALSGADGLAMFAQQHYDAIAVDWYMPQLDGLAIIRKLARQSVSTPVIMVTGMGDELIAVEAMKAGARDYIVKDAAGGYLDLFPSVLEQVLEKQKLEEEQKQAAETLQAYAKELQARNEDLDAFSSMVAHDLLNPLTTVIGFAQVLAEEIETLPQAQQKEYLLFIVKYGNKMMEIIDSLLLMARVRMLDVEMEPVAMEAIIDEVRQRLQPMLDTHRADLVVPETWPPVLGHASLIEEVWINYITNALKYGGNPPRVELGGDVLSEQGVVRFWVRDNGPGIAPEHQKALFRPFKQLNDEDDSGHGLGLAIVDRIVAKLGGAVSVENGETGGSVFSFTLPCA